MFIGVDIGGTKCAVIKGSTEKGIVKKIRFSTAGAEETLQNIISAIKEMGEAKAIGISCGGPLDSKNGIILSPPNLPGWNEIPVCRILKDEFDLPVALQNDANACALAEWKHGAGKGCKNMVFLTFGTGLGAGLILDGKLYSGTNDMAGEVGHIRLSEFGPVGYGKRGSFEGFCSGGGIAETGKMLAREKFQQGEKVSFCRSVQEIENITAKSIGDLAKEGDALSVKVYEICAEKLGRGLSVIIDILNPEKIIIGSVFQRCECLLRDKMQEVVDRESLRRSAKVCQIVPALLGEEIGDYACLSVAENFMR